MQAQTAEPAPAPVAAPAVKATATTTTESASATGKISLGKLVEESKNPEAERIKKEIDSIRDQRSKLIGRLNEFRRRLAYKEKEAIAVDKMLKIESGKERPKGGRIGYLKRMKSQLEFKISTEASSLSDERALVRKIDEIGKQLDDALALVRLERKRELVKGDIETFRKGIMDLDKEIVGMDVKLDAVYSELRKVLGIGGYKHGPAPGADGKMQHKKRAPAAQIKEINLEDIAVIKRKGAKHVAAEGA